MVLRIEPRTLYMLSKHYIYPWATSPATESKNNFKLIRKHKRNKKNSTRDLRLGWLTWGSLRKHFFYINLFNVCVWVHRRFESSWKSKDNWRNWLFSFTTWILERNSGCQAWQKVLLTCWAYDLTYSFCFVCFCIVCFEAGSHYIALAGLKLIHLLLPPKCLD